MPNNDPAAVTAALGTFSLIILVIALASIVFSIIIYWKIFSKAGYSGALSLLMLVPIANIVMLCVLAFGEWPIYQELNQLRQMAAARGMQNPAYPQNPVYPQNPQYR
ncbi:MAG TPA: hypothetical protein VFB60_14135 [Ktedonobacteraceae bacterium]|nr:hypothetical protein [Ktedonobacteraceae bacterium]